MLMLKVKFVRNLDILDTISSSLETVLFSPKEMLGILDLKSVGYYRIKHGVFQQNINRYFKFELADELMSGMINL